MRTGDSEITSKVDGGDAAPVLLPPQALPAVVPLAAAAVMVVAVALGTVVTVGGDFFGSSDREATRDVARSTTGGRSEVLSIAADRTAGVFTVLPASFQNAPDSVLAQLTMPEADKRRLAQELADGRVRLAAVTLWDTMDEDGDLVEVSAGGFSQNLVILHKPKTFFLPLQPGGSVSIKALRDGGGGGVTLGVSTVLGPLPLPPLAPGQSLEIAAL
jgi:hypothetical protein